MSKRKNKEKTERYFFTASEKVDAWIKKGCETTGLEAPKYVYMRLHMLADAETTEQGHGGNT